MKAFWFEPENYVKEGIPFRELWIPLTNVSDSKLMELGAGLGVRVSEALASSANSKVRQFFYFADVRNTPGKDLSVVPEVAQSDDALVLVGTYRPKKVMKVYDIFPSPKVRCLAKGFWFVDTEEKKTCYQYTQLANLIMLLRMPAGEGIKLNHYVVGDDPNEGEIEKLVYLGPQKGFYYDY